MILFKFKERYSEKVSNRWTLQLSFLGWSHPFNLEIIEQFKLHGEDKWEDSHSDCYGFRISKYWDWGFNHIYYDGPHCFLDLGFIHIQFLPRNGQCNKCMPNV